jgi:GNAT superfamily N-acetyltransferase
MRSAICPTKLQFHDLASHFLALTARDRFLRFGWVLSDDDVVSYVESLMHSIETVLVVVDVPPEICGVLHLDVTGRCADLGLSVSGWVRGKGIGTLLLERACRLASARGVTTLFMRNLNRMPALMRLARRVGMNVICAPRAGANQLESPAGSNGATRHDASSADVTLADYDLRFQWNSRLPVDSPNVETPEQSLDHRPPSARQVKGRTQPHHRAALQATHKALCGAH